jgi:hypothetical protein
MSSRTRRVYDRDHAFQDGGRRGISLDSQTRHSKGSGVTESGDSNSPPQSGGDAERQPTDPALHPDFDALVARAFADSPPQSPAAEAPPISIDDLDKLWAAFLRLEEWIFLVQSVPGRDPFPFIGRLDDQLWMFLFTDHERLRRFADARGLLDAELNAHFITMSPVQSIDWLTRLHEAQQNPEPGATAGVANSERTPPIYGIRVNEGPHGWYAPLESLPAIYGHLEELGRL